MVNLIVYMLKNKETKAWWGFNEWVPDTPKGGSVWFNLEKAKEFTAKFKGVEIDIIPMRLTELTHVE